MPHKRAKRIVREQQRSEKGADLAPGMQSLGNEAVPKSMVRILNAAKIRNDWKDKKRKLEEGHSDNVKDGVRKKKRKMDIADGKRKPPVIQPGETLRHFNKRVEDDMRPMVKSAMRTSSVVSKKVRRAEFKANTQAKQKNKSESKPQDPPPLISAETHSHPKEFITTPSSAPRRLNDVVRAPPELNKLPRGVDPRNQKVGAGKRDGILSMAQTLMMEVERDKAILRYREMKERKRGTNLDVESLAQRGHCERGHDRGRKREVSKSDS